MIVATEDFTVKEAAETLGLSESRVRRLCIDNSIGRIRGRDRFLTHSEIERLDKIRKPPGRPKKIS